MWAVKLPAYVEANNDSYGYTCAEFGTAVPGSDQLTIRAHSSRSLRPPRWRKCRQIKLQTSRVHGTLFASGTLPPAYLPPLSETPR